MADERAVEVVLLDSDDVVHSVEDVGHFNESAYYNFFDAERPVGGWARIGNRPNEGYAEVTEGGEASRGYVFRKGQPNLEVVRVDLESDFGGPEKTHRSIRARLHAANGESFDVSGRVLSLVPCRNRRAGWVTRISEAMTEWRLGDRRGYGMSEYLDHLVKGEQGAS